MFEEKDDTILARWLAGTLTPEENLEFMESTEYKDYVQIVNGLERFEKPAFNKEALRIKIKDQINDVQKRKVVYLKPIFYAASVAASVILIIGLFFYEIKYETSFGQQLAITLPNGTEVQLNAQSELTHVRFFWKSNQKVALKGEGYFKVEKGNDFKVVTTSGTVSVLGTQFNIKERADNFELTCYEGKVEFESAVSKEKIILTQHESIKLLDDVLEKSTVTDDIPSWVNGRSSFDNAPLNQVLEELKNQYNIKIENNTALDISKRFSGSFPHDNLDIALKTVLIPMGIEYELTNNGEVLNILASPS